MKYKHTRNIKITLFIILLIAGGTWVSFAQTAERLILGSHPANVLIETQTTGDEPLFQPVAQPTSNTILIKFKDEAEVGAVADQLIENNQKFATINLDDNLDRLNTKYKVKRMRRLFSEMVGGKKSLAGQISVTQAKKLHQENRQYYNDRVKDIKERIAGKRLRSMDREVPYLGNIYELELSSRENIAQICAAYALDPHVEYAQPNYEIKTQFTPNDPYFSNSDSWGQAYDDLWGLKTDKMNMEPAWDINQGNGIVVAVVDSGLDYNHPDIMNNVWINPGEIAGNGSDDDGNGFIDDIFGWNFYSNTDDIMDDNGHGTHVSGTIAAEGGNRIGVIGVAPLAKIMSLKCLGATGSGNVNHLAAGIIYAADNGADVINNSWGCTFQCPSSSVAEDASRYAYGLGAVVVFAAGNSNKDVQDYSPQNIKETITVASSTEIDARSSFSNFGILIDVAAPGGGENVSPPSFDPWRNILSLKSSQGTALYGGGSLIVGTDYVRQAGTSMAAPHVSGLAALVIANNPTFTVEQVRQVIRRAGDDVGSLGFDEQAGYGRVNAYQSLLETAPLEALITERFLDKFQHQQSISFSGTATGPGFLNFELEYASESDPNIWQPIAFSTNPVVNSNLGTWDISQIVDGKYIVRLTARNTFAELYEDRVMIEKDSTYFTSPKNGDVNNPFDDLHFVGSVADTVTGYTIEYGSGLNPTQWTTEGITLTGLGQGGLLDETIAVLNADTITTDGFYTFRFRANYATGEVTEEYAKMVYFDSNLKSGWPKRLEFGNSLSFEEFQPFRIADLDGDGAKEIITVHVVSDPEMTSADLIVYNADGTIQWQKTIPNDISYLPDAAPLVADLDGDNFSEIIVQGDFSGQILEGFNHDGSPLAGWPISLDIFGPRKMAADLDRNGTVEMIAHSYAGGKLYIINGNGSIANEINLPNQGSSYWVKPHFPALGDFDNDFDLEIVVPQGSNNQITIINSDGSTVPGWPVTIAEGRIQSIVTGDIDNDNLDELVATVDFIDYGASTDALIYVIEHDGIIMPSWPKTIASTLSIGSAVLVDIDEDGDMEINVPVISSNMLTQYLYHHNGQSVAGWPSSISYAGRFNQLLSSTIKDITGDGEPEILIAHSGIAKELITEGDASTSGGVWAWDKNGTLLTLSPSANLNPLITELAGVGNIIWNIHPVAVDDLDGNGAVEIIASTTGNILWHEDNNFQSAAKGNSIIYVWELNSSSDSSGLSDWPQFLHDERNTGRNSFVDDSQAPSVPQGVILSNATSNSLMMQWNASVDNVQVNGYRINVATDIDFNMTVPNYADRDVGNVTQTTITGLLTDTTYYARVRAYDLAGNISGYSSAATLKTLSGSPEQTPWQTNAYGDVLTNVAWDFTAGYHFTANKNGTITQLGGLFNGTKTVYLWNHSTQQLLAQADISSNNDWQFSDIAPLQVQSGQKYTVAVYLGGNGASARSSLNPPLPQTYDDITIEAGTYIPGFIIPTNHIDTAVYGQVDIKFMPETGGGGDFIAHWNFDGSANDSVGGNHGVVVGAALIPGVSGQAYDFNGTSDYIAIENLNYNSAGAIPELSVCSWVKTAFSGRAYDSNWAILDFDHSEYFSLFVHGNGKVGFATAGHNSYSSAAVNDNQWHHVCGVYDGVDKHIYVDGNLNATVSNPHNGSPIGTGVARYGFIGDGSEATSFNGARNNKYFEGSLDDVRLYHSTLSAAEIAGLYAPSPPPGGNNAPVLDPIGDKVVTKGQLLSFTVTATDADAGDVLTFSASNQPSGASFDASTQTFSWTPSGRQTGSYPDVHFEVTDGADIDFEDITITVNNSAGGGGR